MAFTLHGHFGPLLRGKASNYMDSAFLKVGIAQDWAWKNTRKGIPDLLDTRGEALLDTGADLCRIDQHLAARLGMRQNPRQTHSIAADGFNLPTDVYYVQVAFPGHSWVFDADFAAGDFRAQNFGIILGMDFLRFFDFHLSKKLGIAELQFVEQKETSARPFFDRVRRLIRGSGGNDINRPDASL